MCWNVDTETWNMVQSLQSIPLTKGKEGPIKAMGINLSKELCVGTLTGIIADMLMTCFSISLVFLLLSQSSSLLLIVSSG